MRTLSIAIARAVLLSTLVVAAGCASAPGDDGEEPDLATAQQPVQAEDGWKQFAIVQDGSRASKATGALIVPLRNPDGTVAGVLSNTGPFGIPRRLDARGTCGVTFISPHFAVTAAHCVDGTNVPDPPNNPLTVRQFDVTNASLLGLNAAALIKGTYPSYQPLATPMASVPGYQSTALSCKVVSRCATPLVQGSPAFNCDFTGDIAMLVCDGRPADAPWLPIAAADPLVGPVEMYWFHELLSPIPLTQPTAGQPLTAFDRFAHYTSYNGHNPPRLVDQLANWHYIDSPTNALLPLKSVPWSDGAPRKRLFNSTATDLFACHGTSGSGVLQRNAAGDLELLGPVSTSGTWGSSRICVDPDAFQPGDTGLSYTSNSVARQLQSKFSRSLRFDRYPIIATPVPILPVRE